jgi:gliding motility-associated-like protein
MKTTSSRVIAAVWLLALLLILSPAFAQELTILNNNKLRMGNGGENSVNTSGNLQQPFYYSPSAGWRKLTYSIYPLDNAFAVGGDKTNVWNLNGNLQQNPQLSNQAIDKSGFTYTDGNNGYGTIISKGTVQMDNNGTQVPLEITNTYNMPQPNSYVEIRSKVKNTSEVPVENVRIWVGTRDDFVGGSDRPTKKKGNLVDGAFQKIANAADRSSALLISTAQEAILFYTTSSRGNTLINSCCSWENIIYQDPETSTTEVTSDGSYGFYVRFNDLQPGESDEFVWYYAAGPISEITNIIGQVAAASARIGQLTSTGGNFKATSATAGNGYWIVVPAGSVAPTSAQIKAGIPYGNVPIKSSGGSEMPANVETSFTIANLEPGSGYVLYFVMQDSGTNAYSEIITTAFETPAPMPTLHVSRQPKELYYPFFTTLDDSVVVESDTAYVYSNPSVSISTGFVPSQEYLSVGNFAPEHTPSWDYNNGILTFSGSAKGAVWQQIFRQVRFASWAGNTNDRVITYKLADAAPVSRTIKYKDGWVLSKDSINENMPAGSVVGRFAIQGSSPDQQFYYQLGGYPASEDNAYFTMSGDTLKTNASFDYESRRSYTVSMQVYDQNENSTTKSFTIRINDLNDTQPIITAEQVFNLEENSPVEKSVGVVALDNKNEELSYTWQFISGNTDGAFAIHADGSISVAKSPVLDYEKTKQFKLYLTASNNSGTSDTTFVLVNLTNLNDTKPVVTAEQSFTINENTVAETTVGLLEASDADGETQYGSWAITSGNIGEAFLINPATGVISVNSSTPLDFELRTSFSLGVTVQDGINTSEIALVSINLTNLNDTKPVITVEQVFSIYENSLLETAAGTVLVTDADGETTYDSWAIVSGNTENAFVINPSTGIISVNASAPIDFEKLHQFTLSLTVADGINTSLPTNVVVRVLDVNDNAPVISAGQVFAIKENSPIGNIPGTIEISDVDDTPVFANWQIIGGNPNLAFGINAQTGQLTVFNPSQIDYESVKSYTLTISVFDGVFTVSQTVTIVIENTDDNGPTDITLSNAILSESAEPGKVAGLLTTTDVDFETYVYELVSGTGDTHNGKFAIVGNKLVTGQAQVFNYDYEKSLSVRIRTTDEDGDFFEKSFTITITENMEVVLSIPTAFTPNGDQTNDTWEIDRLNSFPNSVVKVYDADGREVFQNTGYTAQWDGTYRGKELPFGSYYYVITLNGITGGIYKGSVMILR